MVEPLYHHAPWEDAETLVRAAGGYVRPSDELRPRVLEAARVESRERQAQRRIWQAALAITLLIGILAAAGSRFDLPAPFSASMLQAQANVRAAEGDGAGWSMVDSFTDLRRRQAALLNLSQ
jgi:ferric-dicitrate binding protein FerR (iron transport regulator)